PEFPLAMRPEVSSVPDLLIELEREIFRDEPGQDHPTQLTPIPESTHPMMAEPPVEEIDALAPEEDVEPQGVFISELPLIPAVPEVLPGPLREVPVDSHREPEAVVSEREPEPVATAVPESSNVLFDQEPALRFDEEVAPAPPPRTPDTGMRIAAGLGAAACVLLAVTFKAATVTGVPVNGIHSSQVAGIEPAVQQGPDGTITIDLTRPVRVTAFTLPATGGYSWRLVVDLHTS